MLKNYESVVQIAFLYRIQMYELFLSKTLVYDARDFVCKLVLDVPMAEKEKIHGEYDVHFLKVRSAVSATIISTNMFGVNQCKQRDTDASIHAELDKLDKEKEERWKNMIEGEGGGKE
jgi:hypothetical protein